MTKNTQCVRLFGSCRYDGDESLIIFVCQLSCILLFFLRRHKTDLGEIVLKTTIHYNCNKIGPKVDANTVIVI